MEILKDKIEQLIDNSEYTEAADLAAKELGLELKFEGVRFDSMPWDKDGQKRYIVDCVLVRGKKSYRFDYGTSTLESCVEESKWDVLADKDMIEVYAGLKIGDTVSGGITFSITKNEIENVEQEFLETKANELHKRLADNISRDNAKWYKQFEDGKISRNLRDSKIFGSNIPEGMFIQCVQRAIKRTINTLKTEKEISKTKALPQSQMPSMYDIITGLTWYDPETFEDFCANYGYDEDSRFAEKTYKAVKKEWNQLKLMFNEDELETLSYIQ